MLIQTSSILQDSNSIFKNARAILSDGVALVTSESTATFYKSEFRNNTAPETGTLSVENNSIVTLNNTNFEQNYSKLGSSCVKAELSEMLVYESVFTSFNSTAIIMRNSEKSFKIQDSEFKQGGSF